jgi:carboxypeptidase C (cathepsin A)
MLISIALDFATIAFHDGNDVPYPLFLPTYAAIAHYHGKHGDRALADVLAEAEEYAANEYPVVLAKGSRLSTAERAAAVTRIAALAGVSEDYVDRVNLRMEHVRYYTELLRDQRLVVGRLDGRFTGWDNDYGRERFTDDPSNQAVMGPYTAALNHYLGTELEYTNDLPYEIISMKVNSSWSYKEFHNSHVRVVDQLAAAMRANPHMKVHVSSGYHDGGTPYFGSQHSMAHLAIPDELRDNISMDHYEAGHMMYVHEPSRIQQSKDLADFIAGASNR